MAGLNSEGGDAGQFRAVLDALGGHLRAGVRAERDGGSQGRLTGVAVDAGDDAAVKLMMSGLSLTMC